MQRSLFTAVSGLRNHQVKMDVIGNNIANVNTTGFKAGRVRFQDILSQTLRGASAPQFGRGGINPAQIGLGMSIAAIDTIHSPGSLQNTGRTTDMAIQGNGFFIMSDGTMNLYTRDGSFSRGADGDLVNAANGFKPLGWMADANGVINTNSPLRTLNIPIGEKVTTKPTENLLFGANLNAVSDVGFNHLTEILVFDSQGGLHVVQVNFEKTGTNTWEWQADWVRLDGTLIQNNVGSGAIFFDAFGNYQTPADAVSAARAAATNSRTAATAAATAAAAAAQQAADAEAAAIAAQLEADTLGTPEAIAAAQLAWEAAAAAAFNAAVAQSNAFEAEAAAQAAEAERARVEAAAATANGRINFAPTGVAPLSITPDFSAMSQVVGPNSAMARYQDGFPSGELESFTIGKTGIISGIYTNGLVREIGQIALASFSNPEGLLKAASNMYQVSTNSGQPRVGAPGQEGRGMIETATLEMSNVDLSYEFTELITTTRAFQANSRIITSSDELLHEVVNLKR